MISNYKLILLFIISSFGIILGRKVDNFFRNDYKYIRDTESFYKIHTVAKKWEEAKVMCQMEGASLFYPEDSDEAHVVMSYLNQTQPSINWIFIGVADWNAKEVFDTIDGRSISEVYNAWAPGEPNNHGGVEGCVEMRKRDGLINDENCNRRFPFICKKSLATLKWNTLCDLPDTHYEYNDFLDSCYKFHLTPKNWTEAYATCRAEQTHLAIINSDLEANYLVNLTANTPKDEVKVDNLKGAVLLGFKNQGGWITTAAVPLRDSGYNKWGNEQSNGGVDENCGSMLYNGQLNRISCSQKTFFICEHEVQKSVSSVFAMI